MLFNSLTFVAFFVIVLTMYWSMRSWGGRKNLLLVASYIFYGAWNPPFAALLFSTTALDFYLGRKMGRLHGPAERRVWLWISVAVNLSMLGFFKYGNFLLENFQWVLARGGIQYKPPHLDVFLPIGISFYTFHSLSYTLDIYRGVLKPTRSLRDFTRRFVLPAISCGSDRTRRRFSAAIGRTAEMAGRQIFLGPDVDDTRPV